MYFVQAKLIQKAKKSPTLAIHVSSRRAKLGKY